MIVASVLKKPLIPCVLPATGTTTASPCEYPNCRLQSTTLQLSLLSSSTGVAYARNLPVPVLVLVKIALTAPLGAGLSISSRVKGPTLSSRVERVDPSEDKNSVCTET